MKPPREYDIAIPSSHRIMTTPKIAHSMSIDSARRMPCSRWRFRAVSGLSRATARVALILWCSADLQVRRDSRPEGLHYVRPAQRWLRQKQACPSQAFCVFDRFLVGQIMTDAGRVVGDVVLEMK